ncbi:hypothetical protein ACJIZ3_013519 [Penstemon smallii]|uniref:Desiccation-related protein PCC13-62 n=1 Tax=Penstemon smallii TaxID=265156 RepID=A0ABD3RKG0_9LAMI
MAAAKKQNNKNLNRRKKDDNHSFVSRPDEATGPFPEAKKVEEDGRLMPEFADVEERELFEALNLQLESDMGVDQMRHYEVVYLIHENFKEEVEKVNTKVQEFLKEKKGKIWRFSDWGMRRLAYKIQKAKNAHYILMNFELEAKWINEFKNILDKDERIIQKTKESQIMAFSAVLITVLLLFRGGSSTPESKGLPKSDVDLLEFPLNLEYLEAEFFSWGALGRGLDSLEPNLAMGGPSPIGVQKANLSPEIRDIVAQFALQELDHLRAIKRRVPGFARPLMDVSKSSFASIMKNAFGEALVPEFDPYANDINYLLASYLLPYVGLTGYVGATPKLHTPIAKRLVGGLLGVESGQDAVVRTLLYKRFFMKVWPYNYTVAEFTDKISKLRNNLGMNGVKDEGLIVTPEPEQGAEGIISGNILAANSDSLSYARTPEEILRIVYGTGDESVPGLFYPKGANGEIAKSYLSH